MRKSPGCPNCVTLRRELYTVRAALEREKAKNKRYREKAKKGFFGSSTSSAKIPIKPNSLEERQKRKGGAQPGHPGHGREGFDEAAADRVVPVDAVDSCPDCGGPLEDKGETTHSAVDYQPGTKRKVVYRKRKKWCPKCRKVFIPRTPGVLPKALFSNSLLTHVALKHYLEGHTMGQLASELDLPLGSLLGSMRRLADLLQNVPEFLEQAYRQSPVKHADETGWRTDGANGYAWIFLTPNTVIYRFRGTRSGRIAADVLGTERLPGVLVVDRYNGYNRAPCAIQYCYAHLLRAVKDLEVEFPEEQEITTFVLTVAPLLSNAMSLRGLPISDRKYYRRARELKRLIKTAMNRPAVHVAIRHIQSIFNENEARLYQWVEDRRVPAENNTAERELRQLVIARKISFGSQSEAGARTREILMTVWHTLRKRTADAAMRFQQMLDRIAEQPGADPYKLLFAADTS